MLSFLKTFFGSSQVEPCSLEMIVERTSTFLMPQLKAMEKIEGNKFGFITMESVAYILNIAKEVGGRPITDDEFEYFFVGVLGDEYKTMVEHRFRAIRDPMADREEFFRMMKASGKIARADFRRGALNTSNFLVAIAEDHSKWQKSISGMN